MSPSSQVPHSIRVLVTLALLVSLSRSAAAQPPVGAAFTYQGSLTDAGLPPTGAYDFRFSLYTAAGGGTQVGGTIVLDDYAVNAGVFTARLDFGSSVFLGDQRWLQVEIRLGASTGAYTILPRQELTPAPFAIGLSLPYQQTYNSAGSLMNVTNTGAGNAALFTVGGTTTNYGVLGRNSSTGLNAAGVRGENNANSGNAIGVEGVANNSSLGAGVVGRGKSTGGYFEGTGASSNGVTAFGYTNGGYFENVGVGTGLYVTGKGKTRSNATLRVENTEPIQGMAAYMHVNSTYATSHFQNDGAGEVMWLEHHGNGNYIVATSGSDWKFWVDNTGVTHTKVLEILGGADLSEQFDVGGKGAEIEPGMVVSIDPAHEGRLQLASLPYDHRVAGVISGAGGVKPGVMMAQEGSVASGERPVALTGRVYCRATADNGPIEPGDLLTTSSRPGHCMRVDDPSRAQGAILGKAMGSLEKGEGLILVLVGLQ